MHTPTLVPIVYALLIVVKYFMVCIIFAYIPFFYLNLSIMKEADRIKHMNFFAIATVVGNME